MTILKRQGLSAARNAAFAAAVGFLDLPPFLGERGLLCGDARPDYVGPDDWDISSLGRAGLSSLNHTAIMLCRLCPFRNPCMEWAIQTGQPHGIWGGTTPNDRDKIIRMRGI